MFGQKNPITADRLNFTDVALKISTVALDSQ